MKIGVVLCVAVASAALGAVAAWPQDAKAKARDNPAAAQDQPADPAMAKWMKAMTPGPNHKALAEMVGRWKADVSFTSTPGTPPEKSAGTSAFSMIMDDRYLMNDFVGAGPMGPFKGLGITGFNNTTGKYEDIWLDSMGTGLVFSSGTFDAESDAIMYKAEYIDPMTEKPVSARSIMRKVTADEYAFQMHTRSGDQPEFLSLEIRYTRQK